MRRMIEDYDNGNGIIYEHNNIYRPNQFIRKDDRKCYIYYELNDTMPISIYIDIWNCVTIVPLGSGRILMKDFLISNMENILIILLKLSYLILMKKEQRLYK